MAAAARLPTHIVNHIREIRTPLFASFVPHHMGSTSNPFFILNAERRIHPSSEPRHVRVPMPSRLRQIYSKYDANVEFATHGWVFLAEDEIHARHQAFVQQGQLRCVDLAVRYHGMGYVDVLVYDPTSENVFQAFDGGSNDYDRVAHHNQRVATDVERIPKVSFDAWWQGVSRDRRAAAGDT